MVKLPETGPPPPTVKPGPELSVTENGEVFRYVTHK
jgi:hypothetical protein